MARPRSFLAGSAVGAVLAYLLAATVPIGHADETRRDVRLLVSCDEANRPRVLEALRPLPVHLYDLATMERITLEDPEPLRDALAVLKATYQAVGEAREKGSKDSILTVTRMSIGNRETHLAVRVSDIALLDALQASLQKSPALGVAILKREPIQRDSAGAFVSAFRFEVGSAEARTAPEAPIERVAALPLGAILGAIEKAGGQVVNMSGESRRVSTVGGLTASSSLDCTIPDVASVQAVLEALAGIPGVQVTGLSWRLPPAGKGYVRTSITIEVTASLQK